MVLVWSTHRRLRPAAGERVEWQVRLVAGDERPLDEGQTSEESPATDRRGVPLPPRGDQTIGIYPLLRNDTCALLACDSDKGTWALDSLAYLDACHRNDVPAVLERSRSGNGAHVWIFFDAPVAASSARAMGAALLRQAMAARAELDLASYDRFFPSQDFMPKAGFGNLIALPLHGASTKAGTTVFLDPTTMEPWSDQWAFLSSMARMTPEAVESLAETLRPVSAGPALSLAELARAGGPPPPPVVRARLGSELSIERAGLPPAVVAGLKHVGSIANPEFYEKQRLRFSTWDTPRFISAYREDLEWLHLPRGLTEQVQQQLEALGSTVELIDDRPVPAGVNFEFKGPFGLSSMLRSLISSTTNSGCSSLHPARARQ